MSNTKTYDPVIHCLILKRTIIRPINIRKFHPVLTLFVCAERISLKQLFLFQDHTGPKPLYQTTKKGSVSHHIITNGTGHLICDQLFNFTLNINKAVLATIVYITIFPVLKILKQPECQITVPSGVLQCLTVPPQSKGNWTTRYLSTDLLHGLTLLRDNQVCILHRLGRGSSENGLENLDWMPTIYQFLTLSASVCALL